MESFKERLINEHDELKERISKLSTFINGTIFSGLETEEQYDLRAQLNAMLLYCSILERRMKRKNLKIQK